MSEPKLITLRYRFVSLNNKHSSKRKKRELLKKRKEKRKPLIEASKEQNVETKARILSKESNKKKVLSPLVRRPKSMISLLHSTVR